MGRKGAGGLAALRLVPLLALSAAAPSQDRRIERLERRFVCPETLPDDDARMAAVRDFVVAYGRIVPHSSIAARMAARDRLMAKRGCQPETLTHTFPER